MKNNKPMRIKDEDFIKYFNLNSELFKSKFECYISQSFDKDSCVKLTKGEVEDNVKNLYENMGKEIPHISWMTLSEIKNEFFDDNIEIVTTFGNINWVFFYDSFLNFAVEEIKDVNLTMVKIYEEKLAQQEQLLDIMMNIFGFIELDGELILVEIPEHILHFNKNGELHNELGPTIQIGDFKRYYLDGLSVTPKAWSKRLRIALTDSKDGLFNGKSITSDVLRQIQEEIKEIDGDDVSNINEPTVFVFYLDREVLKNPEIRGGFASSVNTVFSQKHFNAIAFFMPTDTEERIECINPKLVPEDEYAKVVKMLEECQKLFDMENKKLD